MRTKWDIDDGSASSRNKSDLGNLLSDVSEFDCIGCFASEPAASSISNNAFAIYISGGELHIKAKDSLGTVFNTFTISSIPDYAEAATKSYILNTF